MLLVLLLLVVEEQFHLEMGDKKQKATITGLRIPKITAEFPWLRQLAVGTTG